VEEVRIAGTAAKTDRTNLLCAVMSVPAAVSVFVAIRHGLTRGSDFQWWGAHLLAGGVDPYRQFLQPDTGHSHLMNQVPNYLHELYVLLLPLGLLRFDVARDIWLAMNLAMAVASVRLLGRAYGLTSGQAILLGLLLAISAPFRIALSTGQNSLLETFCLTLLISMVSGEGFALGLSYFKYSFSPVFVVYLLIRKRWSWLAGSLVAPLLGLVIFWALVHGSAFREALEPFTVNRANGVSLGMGDMMSVDFHLREQLGQHPSRMAGWALAALGSVVLGALVAVRKSLDRASLPALTCASLLLFVHLSYDFVALVIPAAALLSGEWRETTLARCSLRVPAAVCICLLWYVVPSPVAFLPRALYTFDVYAVFGLLLLCFFCVLPKLSLTESVQAGMAGDGGVA
jgi:hypothetical protein